MRILVLSDSESSAERLYTENGLSLYIEFPDTQILFGFGSGDKFIRNARRLKVELTNVTAVLPHARSCVAGGFAQFSKIHPRTPVFAQKTAVREYLTGRGMFKTNDSPAFESLKHHIGRITLFPAFTQLHPQLFAVQPKLFAPPPSCAVKNYVREGADGVINADSFEHEIMLVAFPTGRRRDGCVVVTSCCRRGLPNLLDTVRYYWDDAPVISVIGGFHFTDAKGKLICAPADITDAAAAARKHVSGSVYVCNCGGGKGYERFEEHLAHQTERLRCGEELSF
ncbi:MBL fold hydrolase [Clostridia bacterium]|nr:MBL fold hydrolase [Clostridia bacterium]